MTNGGRPKNSSIAPIFLVNKDSFNQTLSDEEMVFVEQLSQAIYSLEFNSRYASNPKLEDFIKFRTTISANGYRDSSYLFLLGFEHDGKDTSLITVHTIIEDHFTTLGVSKEDLQKNLNALYKKTKSYYKYIYIPVETSITDFLKLEAQGMQALMNRDLKIEIAKILNTDFITRGRGAQRTRDRRVKILNFVNEKLVAYVDAIEESIQQIDNKYHFNREVRAKNVSSNDLSEVIIEAYFSKRRLQFEGKDIQSLSAGERKKALIDIAYAFLCQSPETSGEVILAVDEPESSLHVSMCYQQYERLQEISDVFGKQVFITTHWYGGLPIVNAGRLYHIQKRIGQPPECTIFSLENYFEQRGTHPHDVNLKSFYDLTSSLVSAIRNYPTNWILCEGIADKKYLKNYLPAEVDVKILPVGGCTIIKKLYDYLYLPIENSGDDRSFKGKIFCLIDTDKQGVSLSFDSSTRNKFLNIRRIDIDSNGEIQLVKIQNHITTLTEIEEVLNPSRFYQAYSNLVAKIGTEFQSEDGQETIKQIFDCYEFESTSIHSRILGSDTIFKSNVLGRTLGRDMKELHRFFDANKNLICDEYLVIDQVDELPWIEKIKEFIS